MSPLTALPELSCLSVSGPDAAGFLQSQLTINIEKTNDGKAHVAAYCDPKGRVISTFIVLPESSGVYLLILPAELIPHVLKKFKLYRFRSKVDFKTTDNYQVFGNAVNNQAIVPTAGQIAFSHPLDSGREFILKTDHNPVPTPSRGLIAEANYWCQHEITAAMVWLDARTTEKHLPQSLGLIEAGAVDFDKGCYPGQEIIARLHYLGKPKYELCKFHFSVSNPVENIDTIRDSQGKLLGQSLNHCISEDQCKGLAAISTRALATEALLYINENLIQLNAA